MRFLFKLGAALLAISPLHAQIPDDPLITEQLYLFDYNIDDLWELGLTGEGVNFGVYGREFSFMNDEARANFGGIFAGMTMNEAATAIRVAGTLAAPANDVGTVGVAYNAEWFLFALTNEQAGDVIPSELILAGSGTNSAGQYLNDPEVPIRVIADNFISAFDAGPMREDIDLAQQNNVIFAAGASDWSDIQIDSNYVARNNLPGMIVVNNLDQVTWGNNIFVSVEHDTINDPDNGIPGFRTTVGSGTGFSDRNNISASIVAGTIGLISEEIPFLPARWYMESLASTSGGNTPTGDSGTQSYSFSSTGGGFGTLNATALRQDVIDIALLTEQHRYIAEGQTDLSASVTPNNPQIISFAGAQTTLPVEQALVTVQLANGQSIPTDIVINLAVFDPVAEEFVQVSNWASIAGSNFNTIGEDTFTFLFNDLRGSSSEQDWQIEFMGDVSYTVESVDFELLSGMVYREAVEGAPLGSPITIADTTDATQVRLDYTESVMEVADGETLSVRDAIWLNGGSINVNGTVQGYPERFAALSEEERDEPANAPFAFNRELSLLIGTMPAIPGSDDAQAPVFSVGESGNATFGGGVMVERGTINNAGNFTVDTLMSLMPESSFVNSGTLTLRSGISASAEGSDFENSGTIDLGSGTVFTLSGGTQLDNQVDAAIEGEGRLVFSGDGSSDAFDGSVERTEFATFENLENFVGSSDASNDGRLQNEGDANVSLGFEGGHLINQNAITSSSLSASGNAILANGGMLNLTGDASLQESVFGQYGTFDGGENNLAVIGGFFVNEGLTTNVGQLDLTASEFVFTGASTLEADEVLFGTSSVGTIESGATFSATSMTVGGDVTNNATVDALQAIQVVDEGTLVNNETFAGIETVTVGTAGTFNNNSLLNFALDNELAITGGTFNQNEGGRWTVDSSGAQLSGVNIGSGEALAISISDGGTLNLSAMEEDQLVDLEIATGEIVNADRLTNLRSLVVTGMARLTPSAEGLPGGVAPVVVNEAFELRGVLDMVPELTADPRVRLDVSEVAMDDLDFGADGGIAIPFHGRHTDEADSDPLFTIVLPTGETVAAEGTTFFLESTADSERMRFREGENIFSIVTEEGGSFGEGLNVAASDDLLSLGATITIIEGGAEDGEVLAMAVSDLDNPRLLEFLSVLDTNLAAVSMALGASQVEDGSLDLPEELDAEIEAQAVAVFEEIERIIDEAGADRNQLAQDISPALQAITPRGNAVLQSTLVQIADGHVNGIFRRAEYLRRRGQLRLRPVERSQVEPEGDRYQRMARSILSGETNSVRYDSQNNQYNFERRENLAASEEEPVVLRDGGSWAWYVGGSIEVVDVDGVGSEADNTRQTYQVRAGIDKAFRGGHTVGLGLSSGFHTLDIEDDLGSEQSGFIASVAPYYAFNNDRFAFVGTGGYGAGIFELTRGFQIGATPATQGVADDVVAHQLFGGARASFKMVDRRPWSVLPYVSITASRTQVEDYRESGMTNGFDLAVDEQTIGSVRPGLGFVIDFIGNRNWRNIQGSLDVGYEYEALYDGDDITYNLYNFGSGNNNYSFDYENEHQLRLAPSVSYSISDHTGVFAGYGLTIGSNDLFLHQIDFGIRSRF
ncbi:MAG: autotransporter domain-containing protein [Opitutales bacterium]